MEDNTHVFAKRDKKNLQEGTLVGRKVKEKLSSGKGEENLAANMMR